MVRIKICGITSKKDAFMAVDYGADALGFVFYRKSNRYINPEDAKIIISSLPPFVSATGVFVDEDRIKMEETADFTGLNEIQLHGSEPPDYCEINRKTIKAIRIKDITDLNSLINYKKASAFLLDTYSDKEIGGTGKVFNWDIAVEAKKYGRIILAGGLNSDNIEEAIRHVQPYAVDVSSGVEGSMKGKKDHKKLRIFMELARKALK